MRVLLFKKAEQSLDIAHGIWCGMAIMSSRSVSILLHMAYCAPVIVYTQFDDSDDYSFAVGCSSTWSQGSCVLSCNFCSEFFATLKSRAIRIEKFHEVQEEINELKY